MARIKYNITFDLELTSCIPNQPVVITTESGFNCDSYPTATNNNACQEATPVQFNIKPFDTGIETLVTPDGFNNINVCDDVTYKFSIDNTIDGNLEEPKVMVTADND